MTERMSGPGSTETALAQRQMFVAIETGDMDSLRDAMERGARVSGVVFRRFALEITPLMKAALSSNIKAAEALLSAGASLGEVDRLGQDALFHAAGEASAELLAFFLDKDESPARNLPPLLARACEEGNVEAARLLIGRGASVSKLWDGENALMRSAEYGEIACAMVALAAGADPKALSADGLSAVEIARSSGYPSVALKLEEAIAAMSERDSLKEALGASRAKASRSASL